MLAVPIVLTLFAILNLKETSILSLLVVLTALITFFAFFEFKHIRARDLMPIVCLTALSVAGRMIFVAIPNFKPVLAIAIIAGICFSRESGFLVGALSALISNMFLGQGVWTPWQMYAWGMVGYLAGVLNDSGFFKKNLYIYIFSVMAAMLSNFLLNTWYIFSFITPITIKSALAAYALALPFDISFAVSSLFFLILILVPWKNRLFRIKQKYDIMNKNTF
ncbi:MAG: DUF6580 family putative transport protein [Eubacteriales bacterium]